jgi:3-methyl-2-oxobutanoate hydroxymethyltransferase
MKNSSTTSGPKKITTKIIATMKKSGTRIACLTAYDFITARLLDQAGVDLILVGDSLGMVFQGQQTTLPVTLDEMIYHAKTVVRGVDRAMVIIDMPFMSYQANDEEGFHNAGRVMKETGAGGVKLEGGERTANLVHMMMRAGIPVMGHLGLTPQSIHQFGGFTPRGATPAEAKQLLKDEIGRAHV